MKVGNTNLLKTKWHGQHCDSYDAVPQVQDMGPVGLTPHGELFLCLYLLLHLQLIKSSVINILFIFQLQYVTSTCEQLLIKDMLCEKLYNHLCYVFTNFVFVIYLSLINKNILPEIK